MVSGVVRAPALDLTNEQLLTSHLNAIWLAASGVALSPDIPGILDLAIPNAPLRPEIRAALTAPGLVAKALPRMRQVLAQVLDGEASLPSWMPDSETYLEGVTGITDPALLRASHIKPWKDCTTTEERLDPMNGLLLSALWDAAFDRGLISFSDAGEVLHAPTLSSQARTLLATCGTLPPAPERAAYLRWHRKLHGFT